MNKHRVAEIVKMMKVTEAEAIEIGEVVANEWLLDWSEATNRQYKQAFKDAQFYIRNGYSWETK
jgi:hypothetical protein